MIKISVIIVTYYSQDDLKDCIDSIFKHNDLRDKDLEIIVVDNSSTEIGNQTRQLLRELYDGRINFINSNKNLGYGKGNNLGIRKAIGDIICVINPDIRLSEPVFSKVISEFEADPKLGLLGLKQRRKNNGLDISFYLKPEYDLAFLKGPVTKIANKFNYFNSKYFYLSGAFLFISKVKFEIIGQFDERFFLYLEEPDITNRFLEKNFGVKFISEHEYEHLMGDKDGWSKSVFKNVIQSTEIYLKKYNLNKRWYYLKRSIDCFLKFIVCNFLLKKEKKIRAKNRLKIFVMLLKG